MAINQAYISGLITWNVFHSCQIPQELQAWNNKAALALVMSKNY